MNKKLKELKNQTEAIISKKKNKEEPFEFCNMKYAERLKLKLLMLVTFNLLTLKIIYVFLKREVSQNEINKEAN